MLSNLPPPTGQMKQSFRCFLKFSSTYLRFVTNTKHSSILARHTPDISDLSQVHVYILVFQQQILKYKNFLVANTTVFPFFAFAFLLELWTFVTEGAGGADKVRILTPTTKQKHFDLGKTADI